MITKEVELKLHIELVLTSSIVRQRSNLVTLSDWRWLQTEALLRSGSIRDTARLILGAVRTDSYPLLKVIPR